MITITSKEKSAIESLFNDWRRYNEKYDRLQSRTEGDEQVKANKNVIMSDGVMTGMQAVMNALGYAITEDCKVVSLTGDLENE